MTLNLSSYYKLSTCDMCFVKNIFLFILEFLSPKKAVSDSARNKSGLEVEFEAFTFLSYGQMDYCF